MDVFVCGVKIEHTKFYHSLLVGFLLLYCFQSTQPATHPRTMNGLIHYNNTYYSGLESSSSPYSSSFTIMNDVSPPATTRQDHENNKEQTAPGAPRRISLDEDCLLDIASLVSDDDDEEDDDEEAIILVPSSSCCVGGKKRTRLDEVVATRYRKKAKLAATLAPQQQPQPKSHSHNDHQTQTKRNTKLLRFFVEPTILGSSAVVECPQNVWYSRHELAAIRHECKLSIAASTGTAGGANGGGPCCHQHKNAVAQEIMDLYHQTVADAASTTTTVAKEPVSADFVQLRGLERWTSQTQYQMRQMASKTLRSELYIEQSSQRFLMMDSPTSTSSNNHNNPLEERLAEISRLHSQKAVAWAIRLAQVDIAASHQDRM
jgi:hypothetical protein